MLFNAIHTIKAGQVGSVSSAQAAGRGPLGALLLTLPLLAAVRAGETPAYYVGPSTPPPGSSFVEGTSGCEQLGLCEYPCKTYHSQGSIASYRIFSDSYCSSEITKNEVTVLCDSFNFCKGDMVCAPGQAEDWPATVYVKVEDGFEAGAEIAFTMGQNCPQEPGPGAALQIIGSGDDCIPLQGVNDNLGVSFFPCGTGGLSERTVHANRSTPAKRRHFPPQAFKRAPGVGIRDEPTCKQFDPDPQGTWDYDAYTPSRRVSGNVNCIQGTKPCDIGLEEQTTTTWEMSWQVSAGVEIPFASLSGMIGGGYSESVSSSRSEGYSVPAGQVGFLSAYSKAVQIPGWYRDCDDGQERTGSVLVPMTDGASMTVILTDR